MSLTSLQSLLQMFYNVTSPGIEVRQGDILVSDRDRGCVIHSEAELDQTGLWLS